ncbi:beta-1,6-N-acetylglucosaminyltransferase [Cochlodiniinecator piscidefendens]|uniref:beta-1,6-N-acetylglucosaminyltransferase n=1 Tax=Cochlodiniinecator piscidefendens TaxID=2715756 RepID=UPI00140B593D|nr:beta-1,6-N-acetylglucosaminyltransferase [Cochlodiniinecator piscidefendens]
MSVGIIMLVHTSFNRAAEVARHWSNNGCPVVIHVDKNVKNQDYNDFVESLAGYDQIQFSTRKRCEWGTWSIVEATLIAAEKLLKTNPEVRHVFLASGSCLPLRPVSELRHYLAARPRVDFIESATTQDVSWTVDGLDAERFTLRFPFSWKRQRFLFDRYVRLQRKVRFKRRIPAGLVPHMGSQWWCLTRQTLTALLEDPERATYDAYFRKVWIPDESYFQTLTRLYSTNIESRSLTLSKFDFQGKPHIFYDDHLQLLRRSDCFVARKIWPRADRLYEAFLDENPNEGSRAEPNPGKINQLFSKAVERRTKGRPGLFMQSRFPNRSWENGVTSGPYTVFQGFSDLFEDFEGWLARSTGTRVHGHLFAQERVEFEGRQENYLGALSDAALLRDYNPQAFLTNLIWNSRGERQSFQFSPRDNQKIVELLARDANAQILVITGAWAVPLFYSNANFSEIRVAAARQQKLEGDFVELLRKSYSKARFRIWSMADFVQLPMEPLQGIIDDIGPRGQRRLTEAPKMVDLEGFGQFLQNLKNQGMHPHLVGDFRSDEENDASRRKQRKPYLVK